MRTSQWKTSAAVAAAILFAGALVGCSGDDKDATSSTNLCTATDGLSAEDFRHLDTLREALSKVTPPPELEADWDLYVTGIGADLDPAAQEKFIRTTNTVAQWKLDNC